MPGKVFTQWDNMLNVFFSYSDQVRHLPWLLTGPKHYVHGLHRTVVTKQIIGQTVRYYDAASLRGQVLDDTQHWMAAYYHEHGVAIAEHDHINYTSVYAKQPCKGFGEVYYEISTSDSTWSCASQNSIRVLYQGISYTKLTQEWGSFE